MDKDQLALDINRKQIVNSSTRKVSKITIDCSRNFCRSLKCGWDDYDKAIKIMKSYNRNKYPVIIQFFSRNFMEKGGKKFMEEIENDATGISTLSGMFTNFHTNNLKNKFIIILLIRLKPSKTNWDMVRGE